jgi:hypothetical protein
VQSGEGKLKVSAVFPGTTGLAPIDIGNIHDQQTSVMGLTILPVHCLALALLMIKVKIMEKIIFFTKQPP